MKLISGQHTRKEKPPQSLLLLRNTDTFRLKFMLTAKPFGGKVSVPPRIGYPKGLG